MRSLRNFPAYSSKSSPPFQEYVLGESFGRRQSIDSVSVQAKDQFASLLPVSLRVFHTPETKVVAFNINSKKYWNLPALYNLFLKGNYGRLLLTSPFQVRIFDRNVIF
ncbi:hypothetical protein IMY05_012G0098900 [Salix suchowensis]|nr:hypothetical protein IMY05_012G0098900 [Salix suchowensis]